jgi:hypothetical protein
MSSKISMVAFALAFGIATTFMYANVAEAQGFVEDGLVSYWNFDEIVDETVKDAVGGHNGTFDGPIEVIDGKYGKALEFDGSGAFVRMADPEAFICNEPFTWCAWIKTDVGGCIVSKTDGVLDSDVEGAKTFFVSNGMLALDVGWVGQNSGTTMVNDGDWHYVAITVEDDAFIFYSDGVDAGQGAMAVSSKAEEGFVITIGWDPRCGLAEFPPFTGIIDEVSVYNRALSADEIEQNFDAGVLDLAVEPADKLASTWGAMKASR